MFYLRQRFSENKKYVYKLTKARCGIAVAVGLAWRKNNNMMFFILFDQTRVGSQLFPTSWQMQQRLLVESIIPLKVFGKTIKQGAYPG